MKPIIGLCLIVLSHCLLTHHAFANCSKSFWHRASRMKITAYRHMEIANKHLQRLHKTYALFRPKTKYTDLVAASDYIAGIRHYKQAIDKARQSHRMWARLRRSCKNITNRRTANRAFREMKNLATRVTTALQKIANQYFSIVVRRNVYDYRLPLLRKLRNYGLLNINQRTKSGQSLLELAIRNKAYTAMKTLISWGANVNAWSKSRFRGYRLIHLTIGMPSFRAYMILKQHHANLNNNIIVRNITYTTRDFALYMFWIYYSDSFFQKNMPLERKAALKALAQIHKDLKIHSPRQLQRNARWAPRARKVLVREYGMNGHVHIRHKKKHRYAIRFDEIDNVGECYINGVMRKRVTFWTRKEQGKWIDITRYLTRRRNTIRFRALDSEGGSCFSYKLQLRRNNRVLWKRRRSCCKPHCRLFSRVVLDKTIIVR